MYTMLSIGPLVPGHTMLLTRDHFSCFAEVDDSLSAELEQRRLALSAEFENRFGSLTVFEHGRAGACVPPGLGHDHCYHAHLHFVPAEVDLIALIEREREIELYASWQDYRSGYLEAPEPYLSVWSGGRLGVVRDPADLPHHYIRTLIAGELGEPLFGDWAAFPQDRMLAATRADPRFDFLKGGS